MCLELKENEKIFVAFEKLNSLFKYVEATYIIEYSSIEEAKEGIIKNLNLGNKIKKIIKGESLWYNTISDIVDVRLNR